MRETSITNRESLYPSITELALCLTLRRIRRSVLQPAQPPMATHVPVPLTSAYYGEALEEVASVLARLQAMSDDPDALACATHGCALLSLGENGTRVNVAPGGSPPGMLQLSPEQFRTQRRPLAQQNVEIEASVRGT